MTPDELIEQVTLSYGQLSEKTGTLFDWLKEIVRDVEAKLLPEYMYEVTTATLSGATTYLYTDAAYIESVAHNDGNSLLYRTTKAGVEQMWSGITDCLYWYPKQQPDGIAIYFNASPTDDVVIKARVFTDLGSDSSVDFPELDYIAPVVLNGLHAKASGVLKDKERLAVYSQQYMAQLGELPQQKGG